MDVVAILAWVLLGILIWYTLKPMYEHFSINASNIWLDRLTGEFELFGLSWTQFRLGGTSIASMSPDTCPKDRPEYDAGLCYPKCRDGYHGVGPVCWADSFNRGVGTVMLPEDCPDGVDKYGNKWQVESVFACTKPLKCETHCDGNWSWSDGGFCHTNCEGGVWGRWWNGGQCTKTSDIPEDANPADYNTDRKDGLCYKPCPENMSSTIPGMPYLCYKGGDLSYGRGVGTVPGLFQFLSKTDYETNI